VVGVFGRLLPVEVEYRDRISVKGLVLGFVFVLCGEYSFSFV
jgi:hypothetical protein